MSSKVPPPPFKMAIVDENGFMSAAFGGWIRDLFNRIGGTSALTNKELEVVQTADLGTLVTDVATLQTTTASQASLVTTLTSAIDDLKKGRVL